MQDGKGMHAVQYAKTGWSFKTIPLKLHSFESMKISYFSIQFDTMIR